EIYFSNITNIDNNTTWAQMCQTYSGFANYQWCREYYWSINGSDPSKAENWTQKAFNPFVVCNLPPMIVKFSAEPRKYGDWPNERYTIRTEFVVRDLRGVREVKQELFELWTNKLVASHTYRPGAGYTVITAGWEFDISGWTLSVYGYNVRGTVTGETGQSVSAEQKISGMLAIVADAITALGAMLLGGLQNTIFVIEGIILIFQMAIPGVGGLLVVIKEVIAAGLKAAIEQWVKVVMLTTAAAVGTVLGAFVPLDNPVWGIVSAIGTFLAPLIALLIQRILGKALGILDFGGLVLCLASFFLSLGAVSMGEWASVFSLFVL
ncbi:MAG: hypothetical protein ACP5JR_05720, partial [Thermoplasmata archaeon]